MSESSGLPISIRSGVTRVGGHDVAWSLSSMEGRPVVFLPGWGCSRRDWDGVISALPDFRCLTVDPPGFGESTGTERCLSIRECATAVGAAIVGAGLGPAAIVGHSLGGMIALELAALDPELVTQVIGVDTFYTPDIYPAQGNEVVRRWLDRFATDPAATVDAIVEGSSNRTTSPRIKRRAKEAMLSSLTPLTLSILADGLRWDMDAALKTAVAPVTVVAVSSLFVPDALVRYAGRISFVEARGVSHWLLAEDPIGTASLIRGALRATGVADPAGEVM